MQDAKCNCKIQNANFLDFKKVSSRNVAQFPMVLRRGAAHRMPASSAPSVKPEGGG